MHIGPRVVTATIKRYQAVSGNLAKRSSKSSSGQVCVTTLRTVGRWEIKPYLKQCRNGIQEQTGQVLVADDEEPQVPHGSQSVPRSLLQLLMGEGHLTYGDLTWQEG